MGDDNIGKGFSLGKFQTILSILGMIIVIVSAFVLVQARASANSDDIRVVDAKLQAVDIRVQALEKQQAVIDNRLANIEKNTDEIKILIKELK